MVLAEDIDTRRVNSVHVRPGTIKAFETGALTRLDLLYGPDDEWGRMFSEFLTLYPLGTMCDNPFRRTYTTLNA